MSNDFYPGTLGEIADVAGEEAAYAFAWEYGGTAVYVPSKVHDGHWMVELVGMDAALKICAHFAAGVLGIHVKLPLGPASRFNIVRRRILAMIDEGRTNRDIALALKISQRTVERASNRQGHKPDPKQGDLF